ncbi:hypothetical protein DRJ53_16860 [Paracnuella aquatica]|nr:hypothetical protein DRJ53_16860 [Paracnuella aquatica]
MAEELLLSSSEFLGFMFDKVVPLEAIGVKEELFLYWRRQGLLPFFPKGAWARFSFAQMIWVRILQDLRSFDYAIGKMLALTEYFFKRAYEDGLPERNLRVAREALQKKVVAGTISDEERALLDYIDEVLRDEALLLAFRYNINYLTNLIVWCLSSGEEAGILIFSDGKVGEYASGRYYSGGVVGGVDPSAPHIYLSIRHYLGEFMEQRFVDVVASPLQVFSEWEQKVLRAIKDPRNREVRVELRRGKINKVEVVAEDVILKGLDAEALRKALGLKNYERIVVDTVDEKSLVVRKTIKKV